MRRIGAMIAATALAAIGVVALSGAAHATGTCDEDGTYYCYEQDGPDGGVKDATSIGSDHHEHAQAQAFSSAQVFAAYLDVSTNGGATWDGWQDTVYNDGSPVTQWTDQEYDGPGYSVRACINVNGLSVCTPWH
jgi:hypothetical protein